MVTEDSPELGGALSCQKKLTKEWCREERRLQDGEGKVWQRSHERDDEGLTKEGSGEDPMGG